jgi:hypothetical protein
MMVGMGRLGALSVAGHVAILALAVGCQRVPEPKEDESRGDDGDTTSSTWGTSSESTTGTSTSTSTTDASTSTTDEATSSNFVMVPDGGGPPQCDFFDPDACPEGEKCTAHSLDGQTLDAFGCFPVMGDQLPDEPCMAFGENPGLSGLDDCAKGSMCWNVDWQTQQGYCIGFCFGSPNDPMCDETHACWVAGGALALCFVACDPVLAAVDCLAQNETCIDVSSGPNPFGCVLDGSGSDGQYGDLCAYENSCDPGLFCAAKEDVPGCPMSGCCSEFCDVNAPNMCAGAGQVCEPWNYYGMAPPGYEHVGGCGLP